MKIKPLLNSTLLPKINQLEVRLKVSGTIATIQNHDYRNGNRTGNDRIAGFGLYTRKGNELPSKKTRLP
jgi:hypothetical protein